MWLKRKQKKVVTYQIGDVVIHTKDHGMGVVTAVSDTRYRVVGSYPPEISRCVWLKFSDLELVLASADINDTQFDQIRPVKFLRDTNALAAYLKNKPIIRQEH